MKIYNNANTYLYIDGDDVKPDDTYEAYGLMTDTTHILSDIGCIEITTEYGSRHFKCFGELYAEQLEGEIDDAGMYVINIRRT